VGQKLFTPQTVLPRLQGLEGDANGTARAGEFSLHAGVDITASERSVRGRRRGRPARCELAAIAHGAGR
jgi:hypothetical protein